MRADSLGGLASLEGRVDHLCVGDHVSFFVGAGDDGLIAATAALLAVQPALPVYVALYLLPLRHPVPGRAPARDARASSRPADSTLGVGIGGEDRHEVEICGVRPGHARAAHGRVPRDPARPARGRAG